MNSVGGLSSSGGGLGRSIPKVAGDAQNVVITELKPLWRLARVGAVRRQRPPRCCCCLVAGCVPSIARAAGGGRCLNVHRM